MRKWRVEGKVRPLFCAEKAATNAREKHNKQKTRRGTATTHARGALCPHAQCVSKVRLHFYAALHRNLTPYFWPMVLAKRPQLHTQRRRSLSSSGPLWRPSATQLGDTTTLPRERPATAKSRFYGPILWAPLILHCTALRPASKQARLLSRRARQLHKQMYDSHSQVQCSLSRQSG